MPAVLEAMAYQMSPVQISNFCASVLKPIVPGLGFGGLPAVFHVATLESPTRVDRPVPIVK